MNEDFDKKFSLRFIQTLNKHLPAKRKTLRDLLAEDRPVIKNKDGTSHFFDKKELKILESMIPEREQGALRLPLYLEMSSSMERGSIRVSGRIECEIIKKILYGKEASETDEIKDSMIIYYPQLPGIRKELSTTTQFIFTV